MTVLGVVFRPQVPPERLREVVRVADSAGPAEPCRPGHPLVG